MRTPRPTAGIPRGPPYEVGEIAVREQVKAMTQAQGTVDVLELLDRQISPFQIRVLVLCALAVMLDGFDIQMIGYVAPAIAQDLHLGPAGISPVFASGLLGLTIGALIFGPVADWVGRRPTIIAGCVLFGAISLVTAMAHSAASLTILRFIGGLGLGGVMPNAIALTSEFCPQRYHGTMVMIMCSGFPLGAVLGGFAAAPMIPAFGWRSVFVLGGILPFLLAPVLVFMLPESIRYLALQRGKSPRMAQLLARVDPQLVIGPETTFVIPEERSPGVPVGHLFRQGRALPTILMWIVFFVTLLDLFLFSNWLPTVFHNAGISLSLSVIATALFSGGGVLGALVLGSIFDRFGLYRVLAITYLLGAVFVALLGPSHSIAAIMICSFFGGVGIVGGQIGANVLAASFYPTFIRSTGVGWALGIGRIGSVVGPIFGGIMLSLHWPQTTMFLAAAMPVLCGSAAIVLLGRTQGAGVAQHRVSPRFRMRSGGAEPLVQGESTDLP